MTESSRYELLGEIGSGGMGIVYKARDRDTAEIIALKVLKPEISSDESMLQRFKNELRLARKITHKNVCRIYDLNRVDGDFCISMELVEGESLRPVLKRFGALGLRKGIQIAQQICAGLKEAHAQGIVHRDLKPENIMIDRGGNIKIMDFGIARAIDMGATTLTAMVGTPSYMSPEQAQSKPADTRSDIYSLGLILYEMFTGVVAFRGETPIAVALRQISETPSTPAKLEPSIPAYIEKAIMRCLEKDPNKRFQSVADLEEVLLDRAFWTPTDPDTAELALPVRSDKWQRSDWTLLGGAVVALGVFVMTFFAFHPAALLQQAGVSSAPSTRAFYTFPALIAAILLLFFRRQLFKQVPLTANLKVAAILGLGAAVGMPIPWEYVGPGATFFKIGMPLLFFLLTFIVSYCIVTTVLYYGRKRCAIQVSGYLLFLTERFFSKPVGLEMLRGILAGALFAGVWMTLAGIGVAAGVMEIGFPFWITMNANDLFPFLALGEALLVAWLLIAFPMSLFAGAITRMPALVASVAVLWIVMGVSLTGAMVLPPPAFEISAALQAVFFAVVFQRYGISAVGAAVLTSEALLLVLPFVLTFRGIPQAVPIAVWGLTVLASCALYFGEEIIGLYRRIAAMFD